MKNEVDRLLQASNVVASDNGGGEDTPTITSSGSYWGNTKRSKQEILQRRVVYVKSKQVIGVSCRRDIHHKNTTTKLYHNFGAA